MLCLFVELKAVSVCRVEGYVCLQRGRLCLFVELTAVSVCREEGCVCL